MKHYDQRTAETMLRAHDAQVISASDAGHTFSLNPTTHGTVAQNSTEMSKISESSDEMLNTVDWAKRLDSRAQERATPSRGVFLLQPNQTFRCVREDFLS